MSSKPKTRGLAEILRLEKERRAQEEFTSAPNATVALDAPQASRTTVAEINPQLVLSAPVAPNTTVASGTPVAPHAPVVAGYIGVTNDLLDRILPTLDPYEQVVLLRLYRLTHGFNQEVAKVGHKKLISACNVKKRKLSDAIQMLERRGFIERVGMEQGGANREDRGTHYRMLIPGPTSARRATNASHATSASSATVAPNDPYKRKALKENNKRVSASLDTKDCPDCDGMGVRYVDPLDYSKGTIKCRHERMGK
jgi:hypothetical protein